MSDFLSEAELLLRNGQPEQALVSLTQAVKSQPHDVRGHIFMAQLMAILGQWARAHTRLNVAAQIAPEVHPMREMMGHALRCELMREQVFAGQRVPMVFGQPSQWIALMIESLLQLGRGHKAHSADLATQALELAPVTAGQIDGEPFEWVADADSRLGPVLEAYVNGRYYWIPFDCLACVRTEAPVDLRDMVWTPAYLTFVNGGEVVAMVPTRYPQSHASADGAIQMARKTQWLDLGDERYAGLGQRVLTTNAGEFDWATVRRIELSPQPGLVAPTVDLTQGACIG